MLTKVTQNYRRHPESFWIICLLAFLVSFTSISVDLVTPSLPLLTKYFDASSGEVKLLVNAFFLGFAIAHLFWGVLSDRFGRRSILVIGLSLHFIATLACILSNDLNILLGFRFLQGVGGASCVILTRAVVRDIYGAERATKAMATVILVFIPIPIITPILGGFLIMHFSWQSLFFIMALCGLLALILVLVLLAETAPIKSVSSKLDPDQRGFLPVIKNRFFMKNTLTNMFGFGALLICITNFPYFLYDNYNFTPQQVGWFFALFDAALGLGVIALRVVVPRFGLKRTVYTGLYLIAFGWTALTLLYVSDISQFMYSAIAILMSCVGMGVVMTLTPGQAMVPFTANSGAASSLYGILQYGGSTLMVTMVNSFQGESILPAIITAAVASYLSIICYWGFGKSARHKV
jgi:MFS transporter, DHA1 family, multidrug resistance protein